MNVAYEAIIPSGTVSGVEIVTEESMTEEGPVTIQRKVYNVLQIEDYEGEDWCIIRRHNCYHDEGGQCDPWEIVAQFGEIPEEE